MMYQNIFYGQKRNINVRMSMIPRIFFIAFMKTLIKKASH